MRMNAHVFILFLPVQMSNKHLKMTGFSHSKTSTKKITISFLIFITTVG